MKGWSRYWGNRHQQGRADLVAILKTIGVKQKLMTAAHMFVSALITMTRNGTFLHGGMHTKKIDVGLKRIDYKIKKCRLTYIFSNEVYSCKFEAQRTRSGFIFIE